MKNWIITDMGEAINLDSLSKIMWGGHFTTPKPLVVTYYFSITKGTGATLSYTYANQNLAYEAYERVLTAIINLEAATDLRPVNNVSILTITPNTGLKDSGGDIVQINGGPFSTTGSIIYVNTTKVAIATMTSNLLTFTAPAMATGGYDVTYFDDFGNSIVVPNALTYA